MPETKPTTRPSGNALSSWTIAIACLVSGALFFPTPLPLGVPFISIGLLVLAPRLPWARKKLIAMMEGYPKLSARVLKNPPKWLERRLSEAGIPVPDPPVPPATERARQNGEPADPIRAPVRMEGPARAVNPASPSATAHRSQPSRRSA